jgi:hypothetical protein
MREWRKKSEGSKAISKNIPYQSKKDDSFSGKLISVLIKKRAPGDGRSMNKGSWEKIEDPNVLTLRGEICPGKFP